MRRDLIEDPELQQLAQEVTRVLGDEACSAANNRAYDLAAFAKDGDADEWLAVFNDLFNVELRRLLRPH